MSTSRFLRVGLVLGVAAWANSAHAQTTQGTGITPNQDNPPTRQGTRGATFLHLLVGARNNAMGGAVGATIKGPEAWLVNPAGAASAEGFSAAGGRQALYGDLGLNQTYGAISLPLLGGAVGVSVNSLNSGNIDRTSPDLPLGDPRNGRTFSWNSIAVSGGYARRLTDRLTVGGQIKFVSEGLTDVSTSWVAFDAGTQFETGIYGLVIGGALQNIGGAARAQGSALQTTVSTNDFSLGDQRQNLNTRDTDLPTAFRFSLADNLLGNAESLFGAGGGKHSLTAEVSVNDAVDLPTQSAVGAEYGFRNVLFLRGGKRFYNDQRSTGSSAAYGLSGGFGVRIPIAERAFHFDYSYTGMGDLRNIQVFSVGFGR